MVSSYHQAEHYQSLHIRIGSGVQYDYDGGESLPLFRDAPAMSISGLKLDTTDIDEAVLSFTPYHLGCSMNV
jgi:hypothetical protein